MQEFPLDGVEDGVALISNVQQTGFFRVNYEVTNSKNGNFKKGELRRNQLAPDRRPSGWQPRKRTQDQPSSGGPDQIFL